MRPVASALLALLASLAPAAAQTIPVQSGDHAGFTRLVLRIGEDRAWSLAPRADGRWALDLTPAVDGFDTARVFDLIQRTRLRGIATEDALLLDLACDCTVSGFRYEGQYLVIDIGDPAPEAARPSEPGPDTRDDAGRAAAALLPDLAALLTMPAALPPIPSEAAQPRPVQRDPAADGSGAAADPGPASAEQPAPATAMAMAEEDPDATRAPNPRLQEAAEIMAEQLARAAAAGLLDAAIDQPTLPQESAPDPAASPAPAPDGQELPAALPIHAQNAFDRALQLDLPIRRAAQPGACSGVDFAVRDWASGAGLDQGLGDLRQALYDERDVLVETAALDLARHYLHYGFGAEAAFWLAQVDAPPVDLLQVAAIVDGRDGAGFPPVEALSECTPGELVWRYLGGAIAVPLDADAIAAIQRAFGELPAPLRDHLGPDLALLLMEDGHVSAAVNLRDALHRGGRLGAESLLVLDLRLGLAPDAPAADTRALLDAALQRNGGDPVRIMAEALAFDRSTNQLPDPGRVTAGEALLRETPPGPDADRLWAEVLMARAALGEIDVALAMLEDTTRGAEARDQALTDLIAERVAVGDVAALLILAHTHGSRWRPQGSEAGRAQVAAIAALRAEGLFEAANILRDVRRPLVLPRPEAPPPDPADAIAEAWRDGDWARLAEDAGGPHADIARRMSALLPDAGAETAGPDPDPSAGAAPAPLPPAVPTDLSGLSGIVADSASLRAAIADLLARPTPVP